MQKIRFSTVINAPRARVWHAMLDRDSYRQWANAFAPNVYYEGSWDEGSEIRLVDPDSNAVMLSRVRENRPYEFVSIQHLGEIGDIKETDKEWTKEALSRQEALESYTFREVEGGATEVLVEMDVDEANRQTVEELWPRALQKLKQLAEEE